MEFTRFQLSLYCVSKYCAVQGILREADPNSLIRMLICYIFFYQNAKLPLLCRLVDLLLIDECPYFNIFEIPRYERKKNVFIYYS